MASPFFKSYKTFGTSFSMDAIFLIFKALSTSLPITHKLMFWLGIYLGCAFSFNTRCRTQDQNFIFGFNSSGSDYRLENFSLPNFKGNTITGIDRIWTKLQFKNN